MTTDTDTQQTIDALRSLIQGEEDAAERYKRMMDVQQIKHHALKKHGYSQTASAAAFIAKRQRDDLRERYEGAKATVEALEAELQHVMRQERRRNRRNLADVGVALKSESTRIRADVTDTDGEDAQRNAD